MRFYVHPDKVSRYLLSPTSPAGTSKYLFFRRFGFDRDVPGLLIEALLNHPNTATLRRVLGHPEGEKLVYECGIDTPDGRHPCIRSVWISNRVAGVIRLVTAYPSSAIQL